MENYDVFISYRRDGGELMAHILFERLSKIGYSVFQDIESLRSGNFNKALLDVIENCTDVILILPPNGLDRCNNEDDWVRKEVEHALKLGKNIIPIMLRGFEWPEVMVTTLEPIKNLNGITANTEYFDQFINKLQTFLKSSVNTTRQRMRHSLRIALVVSIYSALFLLLLYQVLILKKPLELWERVICFAVVLAGASWLLNQIETRPNFAAACFGTLTEEDLNKSVDEVYSRITSAFGKKILISREVPKGYQSYCTLKRLEFGSWDNKKINYLKIEFQRRLEWYDPSVLFLHSLSKGDQAIKMLIRQGFILQANPLDQSGTVDYLLKGNMRVFLYYKRNRINEMKYFHCTDEELREYYDGE